MMGHHNWSFLLFLCCSVVIPCVISRVSAVLGATKRKRGSGARDRDILLKAKKKEEKSTDSSFLAFKLAARREAVATSMMNDCVQMNNNNNSSQRK